MKGTEKDEVVELLKKALGERYVSDSDFDVQVYSDDMTTAEPHPPDVVVMANSVEEVQEVVRIANARNVPLVPYVNGSNVAGLTIARQGGILLDLKRMDKIAEINHECNYAIIEPGVTFGQLKTTLEKHNLRNSIIYGPRNNSVLADYLSAGSGDLMTKYGNHAELITGLEVVLPTGEVVKTGSCALSPFWFSLFPLPNLAGLFIGWLGTTGVVTKMGLKVVPLPKYRDVYDLAFDTIDDIVYPLERIGKAEIAEILVNSNWGIITAKKEKDKRTKASKPSDLPETYFEVVVGGQSKAEIDYKRKTIEEIVKDSRQKGCGVSLTEIPEAEKKHHMDTPSAAPGVYTDHRGGGLEWVGSVMPISRWPSAYKRCAKVMEDYGFTPILDMEAEDNFHYGLFRAIIPFNKADPDEMARTRKLMKEVLEITLSEGGVIYKPPDWIAEIIRSKGDPGFFRLMRRIKELLDPNAIMNPGRWGF